MMLEPKPPTMAATPWEASFSTAETALAGFDSSSTVMSLTLCLPLLRLNSSAAVWMPSLNPMPERAMAPVRAICTPTGNSSACAGRAAAMAAAPMSKLRFNMLVTCPTPSV